MIQIERMRCPSGHPLEATYSLSPAFVQIACRRCGVVVQDAGEVGAYKKFERAMEPLKAKRAQHPFEYLRQRSDALECCKTPSNIRTIEKDVHHILGECEICHRRHRKMFADAGSILGKVAGIS